MRVIEVLNMPLNYERYVVARAVNGDLWFWGSWSNREDANRVATELGNGVVVDMED